MTKTSPLRFVKMEGIGNDFIVIDCINQHFTDEEQSKIARFGCDRHFGIGSDGTVLLCPSETCDFRMRMFNPDGTEAEMCGNGIRVFAKFIYDFGFSDKKNISVETLAGIKYIDLYTENDKCYAVKVDMGIPRLQPEEIPFGECSGQKQILGYPIEACGRSFAITCVNMGNPHCVSIVDDINSIKLTEWGPALEKHPLFPKKTNVEFIQIADRENVIMRVWERGAAETLACGTGACASAAAAMLNGKTDKKVNMHLAGGDLIIEWADNGHIFMTGPAETSFLGEVPAAVLDKWLS